MVELIQKIVEIGKGSFAKKGILPKTEEQYLCISLSPCLSALRKCKDCELYPQPEKEWQQLERIRAKVMFDIPLKEELSFLKRLHPDVYKAYRTYDRKQFIEFFNEESRRCYAKHGCSLDTFYDTQHP